MDASIPEDPTVTMTWQSLFDRADKYDVEEADVRSALARRREADADEEEAG